ncbi:MAG TPA: acyltransferase family protein [Aeromicrobium sp.]|nr:acyltransferase family protein [Aeromicrobium sp.]
MTTKEAPTAQKRINRNSALDGARGFFMLVLVVGHFGVTWLYGAWTMLSLFFMTSGYLITMIMLREKKARGRISAIDFYRRRARRLLPALFVLFVVVGGWGLAFGTDTQRTQMKGDILATAAFVMNWRLIEQSDQYFALFEGVSFFRHAWTLAVEEQFYILSPFIVVGLIALNSNRLRLGLLGIGAITSAVIAAQIGVGTVADQARVYYGTDTRIGAIFIGVGLAFVLRNGVPWGSRTLAWMRWVAFCTPLIVIFTVSEMSPFMFEKGGLLLVTLICTTLIISVSDPRDTWFNKLASFGPLVWAGVRIYGIYLWHWPIRLWLEHYAPDMGLLLRLAIGLPITFLVAGISYRYLEEPVIKQGLRGLPGVRNGRLLAMAATVGVLALAFGLGRVPPAPPLDYAKVPPLVAGTPKYVPGDKDLTVGVFGDSVSVGLVRDVPPKAYPDLTFDQLGDNGCDLTDWTPTLFNSGPTAPLEPCPIGKAELGQRISERGIDTVLFMGAQFSSLPHWDHEGNLFDAMSPEHQEKMTDSLDSLLEQTRDAGATFQLATVPCRKVTGADFSDDIRDDAIAYMEANPDVVDQMNNPIELNKFLEDWAVKNGVPVLDLYSAMGCKSGFKPTRGGFDIYLDEMHFSPAGSAMVWSWLAPEVRDTFIREQEGK